jgi:outer membrane protein OmpA-like peptidoglycan-associated protein
MRWLFAFLAVVAVVFLTSPAFANDDLLNTSGDSGLYASSYLQDQDKDKAEDVAESYESHGHYFWFVDVYGGKERMIRDEFPDGRCAGLFGAKVGVTPHLGDHAEFEAAFGGKINVRDGDNSSIFGDLAINALFGNYSYVGAGVSFWDLTEDDTRTAALLVHFGISVTHSGKVAIAAEGRIPFDQFDDADNNYQFWGGLRIRFGGEAGAAGPVAPPPPAPPEAPAPPPPAPPAPQAPAEPEFVWPEVYFPFDQYVLTPESREKIDSVAKYMTDNANVNVTIEGHCCYIGTDEYNLALGQNRADAIRDYLVGKGISTGRLKTVSYGEARPKYDNEKEITRRFNRRGFFVVIKPQ